VREIEEGVSCVQNKEFDYLIGNKIIILDVGRNMVVKRSMEQLPIRANTKFG
jgi:hypothetical protein